MKQTEKTWYLILIATMLLWGAQHPLTKVLRTDFSPFVITFSRTFFAALFLLSISVVTKKIKLITKPRDLLYFGLLAFFSVIYNTMAIAIGVALASPINSSILININPIWVMLLAAIFLGERLTSRKMLGFIVALSGVLILFLSSNSNGLNDLLQSDHFIGNLILLSGSFSIAIQTILLKPISKRYSALTINTYAFSLGSLALVPYGIWQNEFSAFVDASAASWLGFISIGVFCTGLNFFLFTKSLNFLSVSTSASFKLLIPIFATIISVVFLHEPFTPMLLLALTFSLGGIYLIQKKQKPKPAA